MKLHTKMSLALSLIIASAFVPSKHQLPGKWTIFDSNGVPGKEYVEFKNDGTYNVYQAGGQIGERGYYKLDHSIFSIKNAVAGACGDDYWGTYKLTWDGSDSLSLVVIEDSCSARRYDIVGVNPGLRRMKTK
jgi:hypothetical protein